MTQNYLLYSYYRSSCAARVRIALNLKSIPYEITIVNLSKDEQHSAKHRALNPTGTVPLLVERGTNPDTPAEDLFSIGQSIAALEYLEEVSSSETTSLLPPLSNPQQRARVRTLVQIIASHVQPLTNDGPTDKVAEMGGDVGAWGRHWVTKGLRAYEELVAKWHKQDSHDINDDDEEEGGSRSKTKWCSVGEEVTLADVCLLPAVWNARLGGVDLSEFPTIVKIEKEMGRLEAFRRAHYEEQVDTPEGFKVPS